MRKIIFFLIGIAIIFGIYSVVMYSGTIAKERLQEVRLNIKERTRALEQLQQISRINNWQAHLVSFQRVNQKIDLQQVQKLISEIAAKYLVNIIECSKNQNVYALAVLADLDLDVYEFWQACVYQMSGQLQPVSFGLFRPSKPHGKVQGRIQFVNLLEPRDK
jgi:hypothetical protein